MTQQRLGSQSFQILFYSRHGNIKELHMIRRLEDVGHVVLTTGHCGVRDTISELIVEQLSRISPEAGDVNTTIIVGVSHSFTITLELRARDEARQNICFARTNVTLHRLPLRQIDLFKLTNITRSGGIRRITVVIWKEPHIRRLHAISTVINFCSGQTIAHTLHTVLRELRGQKL